MLDPKEQAKGGFRARAERERARREALDGDSAASTGSGAGEAGDGAAIGQADGAESPYAPPSPRAPKRWR